ncbi:hypothetical protein ROZALSC1DRAFT_25524 [Rozella allomycis CSF55]|uniref:Uncharacterized protein n=1 Tax=Rozella allomycis (strain CSF55) TaxID=988480 RepID=A0A4P9YCA6_ROZAC|nr:hypothetical protein ROZALSC1DRAFT_25524 [Rozella allomycis CSF55]
MEAQNLQDNSNSDDNDVTEAYRKLRDANEAFRDRLYKRRVDVFHSIVTDLAQPQNNGSFMRMVRSVKKRKLKDHCQLDHKNINHHMDYFKSTFGSAPMGNFVEEVNFDVENDESVDENDNLLSDVVNLNDDNESILLEEPSSISSLNSININQSNANHGISNLPYSNLYSSSSPSDLGEVMLIDLPCPSTNSTSLSKSHFNHINNRALPYQVDASTNVNHEISNLPASISPILCSSSLPSSDLDEVMLIDLPCPSSISNSSSLSNLNLINNQSLPCQVDASTSNLSKGKSLNDDNERILHKEPSSISSLNSIKSIQSNVNHGISNLPASHSPILCPSSLSPSDPDEVMSIDLPCPPSISNSTSITNLNLIKNQTLPYQVDASSSTSTLKLYTSSKSIKGKSLRSTYLNIFRMRTTQKMIVSSWKNFHLL